jgi:hypothetical protein
MVLCQSVFNSVLPVVIGCSSFALLTFPARDILENHPHPLIPLLHFRKKWACPEKVDSKKRRNLVHFAG